MPKDVAVWDAAGDNEPRPPPPKSTVTPGGQLTQSAVFAYITGLRVGRKFRFLFFFWLQPLPIRNSSLAYLWFQCYRSHNAENSLIYIGNVHYFFK